MNEGNVSTDPALFDIEGVDDPNAFRLRVDEATGVVLGGRLRQLRERFVVPPLSVLDSAQGYWQERKRNWLSLGIESEVGRDAETFNTAGTFSVPVDSTGAETNQSIFDPVVCELVYRWWSPAEGVVLDPFAGGSVRGIVAGVLGREYHGVDLSHTQVEANRLQADRLLSEFTGYTPTWYHGDSAKIVPEVDADLLFSCPPYGDLERYGGGPGDLSAMSPESFHVAYRSIIAGHAARLRRDRFAVFVVGNYRSDRTALVDLAGITVSAFRDAGLDYYCDTLLVTPVGTAAARASATFEAGRKVIRRHQYVLVFVKGDWKKAAHAAEAFHVKGDDAVS